MHRAKCVASLWSFVPVSCPLTVSLHLTLPASPTLCASIATAMPGATSTVCVHGGVTVDGSDAVPSERVWWTKTLFAVPLTSYCTVNVDLLVDDPEPVQPVTSKAVAHNSVARAYVNRRTTSDPSLLDVIRIPEPLVGIPEDYPEISALWLVVDESHSVLQR